MLEEATYAKVYLAAVHREEARAGLLLAEPQMAEHLEVDPEEVVDGVGHSISYTLLVPWRLISYLRPTLTITVYLRYE